MSFSKVFFWGYEHHKSLQICIFWEHAFLMKKRSFAHESVSFLRIIYKVPAVKWKWSRRAIERFIMVICTSTNLFKFYEQHQHLSEKRSQRLNFKFKDFSSKDFPGPIPNSLSFFLFIIWWFQGYISEKNILYFSWMVLRNFCVVDLILFELDRRQTI